jgi:hypothetical protein
MPAIGFGDDQPVRSRLTMFENSEHRTSRSASRCASISRQMDCFFAYGTVGHTRVKRHLMFVTCRIVAREEVMGFIGAIPTQSNKLTCMFCGQEFQSGASRFEGGRRIGYLCYACRAKDLCSVVSPWQAGAPPASLHVNDWPAFAICLTAITTAAVIITLGGLALRTILLFSTHM